MKRRLTFAFIFSAAAAIVAAVAAPSRTEWVRVLAAPAWRMASIASRSRPPEAASIVVWSFAIGFALGFLVAPAFTSTMSPQSARRLLVVNLLAIYAVVVLVLLYFPHIAGGVLESVGGSSAVGDEFLVVLVSRLMPAAFLYLVATTAVAYVTLRQRPTRLTASLAAIWMLTAAGILASVAWYASPLGPAAR